MTVMHLVVTSIFQRCPVFATYIKRNYVCKLHAFLAFTSANNITMTSWRAWWRLDCLLNRLFRRRSKKIARTTGFLLGNPPVTGKFATQRASNAEKCFHLMTSSWHAIFGMRSYKCHHTRDTTHLCLHPPPPPPPPQHTLCISYSQVQYIEGHLLMLYIMEK